MIDRHSPVTEDELHAYVDGELPADRRDAVEAWLATHPEDAARVAEWRAQADAIRARYGAIADEPVPARFDLDRLTRAGGRSWRAIAAAAVIVVVSGRRRGRLDGARRIGGGAEPRSTSSPREALDAHRSTSSRSAIRSRSPAPSARIWCSGCRSGSTTGCACPTSNRAASSSWAAACCPGPFGPAALFMYEGPSGERFTHLLRAHELAADRHALSRRPTASPASTGSIAASPTW